MPGGAQISRPAAPTLEVLLTGCISAREELACFWCRASSCPGAERLGHGCTDTSCRLPSAETGSQHILGTASAVGTRRGSLGPLERKSK